MWIVKDPPVLPLYDPRADLDLALATELMYLRMF